MRDIIPEEAKTEEDINDYKKSIDILTQATAERILKRLAFYLKEKRIKKGISLRTLNKLSGVSISVISDLESAKSIPRIETLIRLGLTLCDDLDEVFLLMLERLDFVGKKEDKPLHKRLQLIKLLQSIGCENGNIYEILNFIHFKRLYQNGPIQGFEEEEAELVESSIKNLQNKMSKLKGKIKEEKEMFSKINEVLKDK